MSNSWEQNEMELVWMNDESLYLTAQSTQPEEMEELFTELWQDNPTKLPFRSFAYSDLDDINWQAVKDACCCDE